MDPDPGSPGVGRGPLAVAPDDAGPDGLVGARARVVELKVEQWSILDPTKEKIENLQL